MKDFASLIAALAELAWPLVVAFLVWGVLHSKGAFGDFIKSLAQRRITTKNALGEFDIAAPSAINSGVTRVATAEGSSGSSGTQGSQITEILKDRDTYPGTVAHYPYLLHSGQLVTPRTAPGNGRWTARLWLEFDRKFGFPIEDVKAVYWRLDTSFAPEHRTIATTAKDAGFELWLSLYGELTVVCVIERTNGETIWLTRYVDLPGRPSD